MPSFGRIGNVDAVKGCGPIVATALLENYEHGSPGDSGSEAPNLHSPGERNLDGGG